MWHSVTVENYSSGQQPTVSKQDFVLETCQRTLVITWDPTKKRSKAHSTFTGEEAYQFVLSVICGLQSQLVGENEIVHQFKCAYREYVQSSERSSHTIRFLEKIMQDAKKIRGQHLLGICQKTYAALARKTLFGQGQISSVLVVGSGQLAEDILLQLKKKVNLYLTARNDSKAYQLVEQHNLELVSWSELEDTHRFSHVVSAVGPEEPLFGRSYFSKWKSQHKSGRAFIDLGGKSSIETELGQDDGVWRLDDILRQGALQKKAQEEKIQLAWRSLKELTQRRFKLQEAALARKQNPVYEGANVVY